MRTLSIVPILIVASCSSPPSRLHGPLPTDAVELLGAICAHANEGRVQSDNELAAAKTAFYYNDFPPGVAAVRCVPEHGPDPMLYSLVFDRETRRLYGVVAVVVHGDLALLDSLVLPALSERERAGYALERMRLNARWAYTDTDHFWTDGHVVITIHWIDPDYNAWPPKSENRFLVSVHPRQ